MIGVFLIPIQAVNNFKLKNLLMLHYTVHFSNTNFQILIFKHVTSYVELKKTGH